MPVPSILVAPRRGDPIVSRDRHEPTHEFQGFLEEIERILNGDLNALSSLTDRVSALEPTRKTITVTDSPYQIVSGDVLKIDKSGGDISVLVPASGWFKFSIESDSNTLTVDGPVNGETDIEFYFDGTGRQAEFVGDWRWV